MTRRALAVAIVPVVLVALGAVQDYRPRRSYWEPSHGTVTRFPGATRRPEARLAA